MNGINNKTEKMKEFKDLEFKNKKNIDAKHAILEFDNEYGVSVITGGNAYGSTVAPYELAVLKYGDLCYDTDITSDVIGYLTSDKVTEYMKLIQEL
jgi:hypothetical protein